MIEEPGQAEPSNETPTEPVMVPHTELSPEILQAVVEAFVLREGTDYGEHEFSLEQKVGRVVRQLERGDAQIVFDPGSESVAIVPAAASAKRNR